MLSPTTLRQRVREVISQEGLTWHIGQRPCPNALSKLARSCNKYREDFYLDGVTRGRITGFTIMETGCTSCGLPYGAHRMRKVCGLSRAQVAAARPADSLVGSRRCTACGHYTDVHRLRDVGPAPSPGIRFNEIRNGVDSSTSAAATTTTHRDVINLAQDNACTNPATVQTPCK